MEEGTRGCLVPPPDTRRLPPRLGGGVAYAPGAKPGVERIAEKGLSFPSPPVGLSGGWGRWACDHAGEGPSVRTEPQSRLWFTGLGWAAQEGGGGHHGS